MGLSSLISLFVTLHLTSRVFVRLTKDTTYLTGNEGQNYERFSLKLLRCRARARKSQYAQWAYHSTITRSDCPVYYQFLTLGAHAQQGLRCWVCLSVLLCVCLSVTRHLTSQVIVRLTKDTTY